MNSQPEAGYDEILSPYTPYTSKITFKKDFFIQSRQEDIRKYYDFYPKVSYLSLSQLEEADMAQFSEPNSRNLPTQTGSSRSSTRGVSATLRSCKMRSTF